MHTHTIAALIRETFQQAMEDTPYGTPMIIGANLAESADIIGISAIRNEGSFLLDLDDGSKFRINVVRVG